MKLYSTMASPFAARVRLGIYSHGLPVEISELPPGGLDSDEFGALTTLRKIPLLVADGMVIPESDTILEFFADRFPQSGLRAASASSVARSRLLARVADLYVFAPGEPLFENLDLSVRDEPAVDRVFESIRRGLSHVEYWLGDGVGLGRSTLTTADCALVSMCWTTIIRDHAFSRTSEWRSLPNLSRYWDQMTSHPVVVQVGREVHGGLIESFGIDVPELAGSDPPRN